MTKMVDASATLKGLKTAESTLLSKFDGQLRLAALMLEGEAKKSIQSGGRSGRQYTRGSITHQASAPGEYPKTDTGALVRNIFSEKRGLLNYWIGSRGRGAPHGAWLEFGTQKMRARPWLSRTIHEHKGKITAIVKGLKWGIK